MGKGIVKRWVRSCLSVTVFFLVFIIFGGVFAARTYYYDGVKHHLQQLGDEAVECCAHDDAKNINIQAYIDGLVRKESVNAVAADAAGSIICYTKELPRELAEADGISYAVETPDSSNFRTVTLSTGEKLMSYSIAVTNENGDFITALCLYESLAPVDRKVMIAILVLVAAAVVLLASFVVPCLMFMNTILKPVRELRATAHRIAQGDYETRVEKMYDDEIGELSESINAMAEDIKLADSMKNDFISSVSHELRTPLTAIKGWAETMSLGEYEPETMNKGLTIIINESERLTGMVEELLDFSRIQSGRIILAMDKTDLLAELGEAVYMLRQRAIKEKKNIVYDEPDSLLPVLADKNRLRQVFINIIDNALKYSPEGSFVKVVVSQEDDFIKVIVADSGCGIAEKDLLRIKEKFYKANKTVRGSGIGLAVADEIVTLHKGKLLIESKEDEGTRVTITIPVLDSDDEEILKR